MIGLASGQRLRTMRHRAAETRHQKIVPLARDEFLVTAKSIRALFRSGVFSRRSHWQFRESGLELRAHNSHMNCHLFWRSVYAWIASVTRGLGEWNLALGRCISVVDLVNGGRDVAGQRRYSDRRNRRTRRCASVCSRASGPVDEPGPQPAGTPRAQLRATRAVEPRHVERTFAAGAGLHTAFGHAR